MAVLFDFLGLFDTIKESVQNIDLCAKEKYYRVCSLVLLDEHERVYEELRECLQYEYYEKLIPNSDFELVWQLIGKYNFV